jgi:hypothetical protein
MSRTCGFILRFAAALPLIGCADNLTTPTERSGTGDTSPLPSLESGRNLEAILRPTGSGTGFGLVKFRQPKDGVAIVELGVWVRDLSPNTTYVLQRANDTSVDDQCTGTNWLTLGQGSVPRSIVTDERGTGRAELFRDLSAFPLGSTFDIHFRVLGPSGATVLESGCYQFTISL